MPNIGSVSIIVIAFFGLISYLPGLSLLGSIREGYIPMAPSTALCFIFLSIVTLFLNFRRPSNARIFILLIFTFIVSAFGILEVLGYFFGMDLNFEETFVPSAGSLNGIPLARMSPATGAAFFLSGLSSYILVIQKKQRSNNIYIEYFGNVLSIFVLLTGFVFCLAYLYGSPLLYDLGSTVPMALTTSLGFIFLSLSTLTINKDAFPLKLFTDGSTRSYLTQYFFPLLILSVILGEILVFSFNRISNINPAFIAALFTVLLIVIAGFVATFVSRHIGREIDRSKDELKLANAALKLSEKKYKTYLENVPAGIFIVDAQANYIDVNEAAVEMTGYSKIELLNMKISDLVAPSSLASTKKTFAILQHENKMETEIILRKKNGEEIDTLIRAVALNNESYMAFCSDISEQKKAEEKNKSNAAQFERWKSSNFIGIIQSDAKGNITDANDTFLEMIGYSRENLSDGTLDWTKLTPSKFSHLDQKAMVEAEEKGFWTPFEKEYIHKDGHHIPILIGGSIIKKEQNEYIVFIINLSVKKETDKQIKHALLEGKETERNRIGMELHDGLGQILVATNMQLNAIEKDIAHNSEELTLAMEHMKNAIHECRNISHGLSSPLLKKYPLKVIINNLIESFYTNSDVKMNFKFQIEGDLSDLLNTQIYRICQEILNNSVKYSKASNITLSLKENDLDQIELIYEDDGIGFELDKVKKGIGLKNMHTRVKALDGYINIISTLNIGTRFEIYLPIVKN